MFCVFFFSTSLFLGTVPWVGSGHDGRLNDARPLSSCHPDKGFPETFDKMGVLLVCSNCGLPTKTVLPRATEVFPDDAYDLH